MAKAHGSTSLVFLRIDCSAACNDVGVDLNEQTSNEQQLNKEVMKLTMTLRYCNTECCVMSSEEYSFLSSCHSSVVDTDTEKSAAADQKARERERERAMRHVQRVE
jgi:hypothetical protein